MEGGFGFEYVNQICIALKNYVARDPDGMMAVGEGQEKTHLALTHHFIRRCLSVNRQSAGDFFDGIAVVSLIIAMLENMQGRLEQDFPHLLVFLWDELEFIQKEKPNNKLYKSMIL